MRRGLFVVLLLLSATTGAGDDWSYPVGIDPASLSANDVATIRYVERTHLQLDHWGGSLIARLERDLAPRQSDPVLDGRYGLLVRKLRLTYAAMAESPSLAEAIRRLADSHERRLRQLERMMYRGVERQRFAQATAQADRAMRAIRPR